MILWEPLSEDKGFSMVDIKVYKHPRGKIADDEEYILRDKIDKYRNLSYSSGNCYFDAWNNMTKDEVIGELFYILLNHPPKNRKVLLKCLFEFGKIDICEPFRLAEEIFLEVYLLQNPALIEQPQITWACSQPL